MTNHFIATVPVTFKDQGQDRTRFQRVGAMFKNTRQDGSTCFTLKLDFPVAVSELVMFEPKDTTDQD